MADPNLPLLEDAVRKLAPFLDEIVFVGGITLGILITDTLLHEVAESPHELRQYLSEAAKALLAESRFLDVLPGFVLNNERVPLIQERLAGLARL